MTQCYDNHLVFFSNIRILPRGVHLFKVKAAVYLLINNFRPNTINAKQQHLLQINQHQ